MDLFLEQINLLEKEKNEVDLEREKLILEKDRLIKEILEIQDQNTKLEEERGKISTFINSVEANKRAKKILVFGNTLFLLLSFILLGSLSLSMYAIVVLVSCMIGLNMVCLSQLWKSRKKSLDISFDQAKDIEEKLDKEMNQKQMCIYEKEVNIQKIEDKLIQLLKDSKIISKNLSIYQEKRLEAIAQVLLSDPVIESKINNLFEKQELRLVRKKD